MQRLAAYTHQPCAEVLGQLLEELHADRSVLIILNHPLWDMAGKINLKQSSSEQSVSMPQQSTIGPFSCAPRPVIFHRSPIPLCSSISNF
jgi:hypothetical protein